MVGFKRAKKVISLSNWAWPRDLAYTKAGSALCDVSFVM